MIAIIDYGVGNLFSLSSSLLAIGQEVVVTSDKDVIAGAERIILPGVGAFADAIAKLRDTGLDRVVIEEAGKGKPIMGICLGMQLLFEKSYEYGEHTGLGLIKGSIIPIKERVSHELKIPHIGWNKIYHNKEHELLKYTPDGEFVYFVHSYFADGCDDSLLTYTEYGEKITASVVYKNVYGAQFHPEKSGTVGLNLLRAFCEWEGK